MLTVRSANALLSEGFRTAAQVRATSDAKLLKLANFGRKSLREVRDTIGAAVVSKAPLKEVHLPKNTPPTKLYDYEFSLRIKAASEEEAFELLKYFVLNRMGAVQFSRTVSAPAPEPSKPLMAPVPKPAKAAPASKQASKKLPTALRLPASLRQKRMGGRRAAAARA
jgi:hypothetical protein